MQISVVSKTDNAVRLSLKDINTTVIEAIIDGLNKDPNVVYARYIVDHPDLVDPMLEIMVSEGTVKEAVGKAASAFADYFKNIEEI